MDEATQSPAAGQAPERSRCGLRLWLAGMTTLVALLVALASCITWALRSEAGTAWLLTLLPGIQVDAPKGLLLGDFEARRVHLQLPGSSDSITLADVGWHGLSVARGDAGRWLRIVIDELHAGRVDVVLAPSQKPLREPVDLQLPLELDVSSLRVRELHLGALGDKPVVQLQARLHLGAAGGAEHRIEQLSLGWDRLQALGTARIASRAPMQLAATFGFAQAAGQALPAWSAGIALAGPLAAPTLQATLRAQPAAAQPAQALDARATLRPFAAWPLGDLQANTQALDLSAFSSAAPVTALSGRAVATSSGLDQPASINIELSNAAAGRWNEKRLPLRRVALALGGRPDNTAVLELQTFEADLGTREQSAGRVSGGGRWSSERWNLTTTLSAIQPALLDTRAAPMQLSGALTLAGGGFGAATPTAPSVDVKADLQGRLADGGPVRLVQIKLDASLAAQRVEVREAQVLAGATRASLTGVVTQLANDAPWRAKGQAALLDFDPAMWWPGFGAAPRRKADNRLNGKATFDLAVPATVATQPWAERLAGVRGEALVTIANSVLAGVPLAGELSLRSTAPHQAVPLLKLDAAGNSVRIEGRFGTQGDGAADRWDVEIAGPELGRLAPALVLLQPAGSDSTLAGSLSASAHLSGRWPSMTSQGRLDASGLRVGTLTAQQAQARWQFGTAADAPVDVEVTLTEATQLRAGAPAGAPSLASVKLQLKGTGRAHTLELRAESKALPPAWTDALRTSASAGTAPAPTGPPRTLAILQAQGGIVDQASAPSAGWRGSVQQIELRSNDAAATPLLRARDVAIELQWAGGPARAVVQPGRAEVLGGVLRWSRIAWRAADGPGTFAQIEAQAQIEPMRIAPLLARAQPDFGWGGDLSIAGTIDLRSSPAFHADIVLERSAGDLTVTDELGTQALGLTDLRVALNASDGVWNFTQALAGTTLGVSAGAIVARTSAASSWPSADTPIEGVLELQVASLGTWGTWVPPGWRLDGALRASASIGGRFGAPEYTGEVRGTGLSVRNFLQGVNVSDGDVLIALQGSSARIEHFSAKGGAGTLRLEGNASLGEAPKALLKLSADKFQLLGRVDRRIVASGQAQLQLDRKTLALTGSFGVDEGAIDFTRSDAPKLSDDVEVVRARGVASPAAAASAAASPAAPAAAAPTSRDVTLDLRVNLGENLRVRGRGLDTGLRGELHITSPNGRLAVNGTVRAAEGTYAAYGQKLSIDRGLITFNGPVDNPRLDIEATRPNLDVRVGVAVTGTAVTPYIRLFSEPELSEIDKLSWLVMGRASEGLGRTDTALLQRAALALLAGEGESVTDQFVKAIGLDEISLRQTDGEVRETVIALGKQLSRRWYVGYERGLNATTGSWQLIYRIAQRFTLRAQSGQENSLDLIWTWRWQ